jgi:hypothetical protein
VCAESHQAESRLKRRHTAATRDPHPGGRGAQSWPYPTKRRVDSSGAIRRPREIRIQVGAAHNRVRRIPPSGEFILKRRHTAATRGTALSIEASRLDRATDRCSCKRSPCTAHSQTGVVANVHHARRTARPVELQTFTMHGAQPDRWACHAHPVSRTARPVVLSSDHRPEVNT